MHTCPDCGQACTCAGDIEDHDTGGEFEDDCTHCGPDAEFADDDDCGYEPDDPKHPTYAERMFDAADRARKIERGE